MKSITFLLLTLLSFMSLAQTESQTEAPWQQLELRNAATGESFSVADFAGKTVFVKPFATWCGNCRRQLNHVRRAVNSLDNADDVVVIALSVAENASDEVLTEYAEQHDFNDFIFASTTPEMLSSLVAAFGRGVTNPPATPHFIIDAEGNSGTLETGLENAEEILEQLHAIIGS